MHAVPLAATAALSIVTAQSSAAVTPDEVMQIPIWVEMFTVIAASAAGAMTARTVRLDLLGTIMLAIVTGLAGGLLRDMMMQVGDVYMLKQPYAIPASAITGIIIFFAPLRGRRIITVMQVIDIINIGLYAAMGADKAFAYDFDVPACILLGGFTGVGGGLFRDICLSVRPALFTAGGNFYGIAAIIGTIGYLVARIEFGVGPTMAAIVCVIVTVAVRWASVRFDIQSPEPMDLTSAAVRTVRKHAPSKGSGHIHAPSVLHVRKPGVRAEAAAQPEVEDDGAPADDLAAARRGSSGTHECFSDEAIDEHQGLDIAEDEQTDLTRAWAEHVARYANNKPAAVPCFHESVFRDPEDGD